MSRQILIGLACLAIALLAALVVLPARWLMVVIPEKWPIVVVDASGSIWQGSALTAVGPAGARTTVPQPIQWRTGWRNGIQLELQHPWLGCALTLRPGIRTLGVSPCTLQLPANVLAGIGAPLNTIKPAGTLRLQWPGLRLPHNGTVPDGVLVNLKWEDAGSALARIRPLGEYRVAITGKNNAAQIELSTISGLLALEGSGALSPGKAFTFKGVARPTPDATEQQIAGLQAMLSAIGRRSGNDTLLQIGR